MSSIIRLFSLSPDRRFEPKLRFLPLLVTRCCGILGLSTLQPEILAYMNGVLDMDMKSTAFFSALPLLAMRVMSFVYLIAADVLLAKIRLRLDRITLAR